MEYDGNSKNPATKVSWFKLLLHLCAWLFVIYTGIYIATDFPDQEQWKIIVSAKTLPGILWLSCMLVFAMLIRGLRWRSLLYQHLPLNPGKAISVFGWTFMVMTFSPMRAGELARVWWVRRKGSSGFSAAGIVLAERMVDMLVLLFYFALASAITIVEIRYLREISFVLLAAGLIVYITISFFLVHITEKLRSLYDKKYFVNNHAVITAILIRIIRLLNGIGSLGSLATNIKAIIYTFLIWGSLIAGCHFYLMAFFPELPVSATIMVLIVVNLSGIFWILPGNFGMYEMSGVVTLSLFGISASGGLVAITGMHSLVLLITAVYGIICRFLMREPEQKFWQII